MPSKPPATSISKEDSDLFQQAVAGSQPLPPSDRHIQRPTKKPFKRNAPAANKFQQLDLLDHSQDVATLETGEQLTFLRDGVNKKLLRQLRRGKFPLDAEVDLHGMTQQLATDCIIEFIESALQHDEQCIGIIHGKALRSPTSRPVLKTLCNHLLRRHPAVIAFTSAKPAAGGSGAVWVLLKTNQEIESTYSGHHL